MHASTDFTCREKAGYHGGLGVRVDLDAAHHVVTSRADLHGFFRDVYIGQFFELVVHGGQPPADELGRAPASDVEEDPTMGRAPAGLYLAIYGAGHFVARQKFRRAAVVRLVGVPTVGLFNVVGRLGFEELRDVVEHEAAVL